MQNQKLWPILDVSEKTDSFNISEKMVYGKPIWLVSNGTIKPFSELKFAKIIILLHSCNIIIFLALPTNFISEACLKQKTVKYLQPLKTTCVHYQIDENPALNAELYFKNVSVLSALHSVNTTKNNTKENVDLRVSNYKACIFVLIEGFMYLLCRKIVQRMFVLP